jgi:hypothetical protein
MKKPWIMGSALAGCAVAACGLSNSLVGPPPKTDLPTNPMVGQCTAAEQPHPYVVQWSGGDLSLLQSKLTHDGLVAAKYKGCTLDIIENCTIPGSYSWRPTTRDSDEIAIDNTSSSS